MVFPSILSDMLDFRFNPYLYAWCWIFEVSDISDELIFRQIKSGMLTGLLLTEAPGASVEAKPSVVLTT